MSTSENQHSDQDGASEIAATKSVGELLSNERHRLGLSEKEVADQLHITMHYVRAIESNSFDKLPGAVFAKGYIKSYALLLGLAEDQVLAGYHEFVSDQQDAAREKTRIQVRRRKDKNRPWVFGSAAAFVGLFVALWLFNGSDEKVEDSSATGLLESARIVEENLSVDAPEPILMAVENEVSNGFQSDSATMDLDPSLEQITDLNSEASEALATPLAELDSVSRDSGFVEADTDVTIVDALLAAAAPASENRDQNQSIESVSSSSDNNRIIVEAVGDDVLVIVFSGESWLEISDGFDELIYRDLQEAGNELQITGTAPFNVLLGDAPFAQISLNGTEIDFSDNVRIDNSARLKVGL